MEKPTGGPPSILVKQLLVNHPDYKPEKMQLYSDLMDPEAFEANKDRYLYKRPIEDIDTTPGKGIRARRLEAATYTPHLAALINYLITSVFNSAPAFVVVGGNAFWSSLNDDADGAGHTLTETTKKVLLEGCVQGRSYISIDFPDGDEATDLAQQKERGDLDGYFCLKGAANVTYWQKDEIGNLIYVRTYDIDAIEDPYQGITGFLHTWTYIFSDHYQEYTAKQEIDANGKPKPFGKDDVANAGPVKAHTLGAVPVIPIDVPHIARLLAPLAKSLFNCEAAHDWLLQTSAYSQMHVATDNPVNKMVSSELNAIVTEREGSIAFPSPNPEHFAALSAQSDNKLRNLYLCLQSMPLQMSSKDSGGRQSGSAKEIDFTFVQNLLAALAQAIKDMLRNAINLLKKARGEDALDIQIVGLDSFDVKGLMAKLELAQAAMELPLPKSAKKYVIGDLATTITSSAPQDVREAVQNEIETLVIPDLPPAPVAAPTDVIPQTTDLNKKGMES